MAEENFVDIASRGNMGNREVRLTPQEIEEIRENPRGLTREGCLFKITLWAHSTNRQVLYKYLAMLKLCKSWEPSGKLTSGRVILARTVHRNQSGVTIPKVWSEDVDVDKLKIFAEQKMPELGNLTKKGA